MRRRHRAGVSRLASARGAIIRRLALQVMWPHAPSAVPICRHWSAPVTTCRHHLPGGPWEALPAERVAGRPGREATHYGGRAPGQVERWHRTCTRSVQQQRATAGGDARRAVPMPQRPASTGVRQARETGQGVPVPDQGEAAGLQGGSPHGPDDA
jgi:hypothetical protein